MLTSQQCVAKYGQPGGKSEGSYMEVWPVPADIRKAFSHVRFSALGTVGFPTKIYCNKLLAPKLEQALRNLIEADKTAELNTWDGCYMVRNARGLKSWSLHAWGLAVDVNASANRLGHEPVLSCAFVTCFTAAGFEWGGNWTGRKDGMHFQLQKL